VERPYGSFQTWKIGLRQYLFLTSMSLVINNPEFKALHTNNGKLKKIKKMKFITKPCGKLDCVLVRIARNASAYKPEMVFPLELP
jgi:transposase